MYAVVPSALDHASKSFHNELSADLPVWDSLQNKTKAWLGFDSALCQKSEKLVR